MSFYLFWVPAVLIMYAVTAVFSKWANDSTGWTWVFGLYVLQCAGLWPLVSKYSKNIVFDGLLYEVIMFVGFYGVLCIMGATKNFTFYQYCGMILVITGMILVKVTGTH